MDAIVRAPYPKGALFGRMPCHPFGKPKDKGLSAQSGTCAETRYNRVAPLIRHTVLGILARAAAQFRMARGDWVSPGRRWALHNSKGPCRRAVRASGSRDAQPVTFRGSPRMPSTEGYGIHLWTLWTRWRSALGPHTRIAAIGRSAA